MSDPAQPAEASPEEERDPTKWGFEEGDEIVPGRYALKSLGGGYDYEAYIAWDDDLFSLVVAKCLRPHLVEDKHARGVLAREAEHLMRLAHPVVVRGFDAVLDGPRPHVVMEHLEGPNLASLIRRYGPVSLEQLLPLTMQICSALHYLHSRNVVHLDVKPRNIIMGAPPRLIDLSIARSFKRAQELKTPVGTDPYMAPEQCDPVDVKPGAPADVFGLGATLYHAAVGKLPFPRTGFDKERDKKNYEVRFPQLFKEHEPFPKNFPAAVADVIAPTLHKEPDARPSVAEVVEAIEPLVAQLPTKPVLRKLRPRLRQKRPR